MLRVARRVQLAPARARGAQEPAGAAQEAEAPKENKGANAPKVVEEEKKPAAEG